MNRNDEVKTIRKAVFEPAEVEVITFDAKTDIICTSPVVGEDDDFYE